MTSPPSPAEDLWRWCNRLTLPLRHRLERESGRAEYLTLPSLLDQLEKDLGETGTGSTGRSKPGSRPPLNVNVLSLLGAISEVVNEALVGEGLTQRLSLSSNLRQLTAHLVTDLADAPDDLAWWSRLLRGWAGEAQTMLPTGEDGPKSRLLRDSFCPECKAWNMQVIRNDEPFREPVLEVTFRDGLVRHVLCRLCGFTAFRGEALWELGEVLNPALRRTA